MSSSRIFDPLARAKLLPEKAPEFLSPLRYRLFAMLWLMNAFSNVGSWMHSTGAGWIMTTYSHSSRLVALVHTAATLPVCLFVIPAGVLADRIQKPRYLFLTQAFMALVAAALGILALLGKLNALSLLVLTFCLGIGNALNMPAWQAAISSLVPKSELPGAATLNNFSFNVARALGPAVGGILISIGGPALVFFCNALSFLGVMLVFADWMRKSVPVEQEHVGFFAAFCEGVVAAKASQSFVGVLKITAFFFFFSSAVWALLPVVATKDLQLAAAGLGALMGCLGLGAFLALPFLSVLRKTKSAEFILNTAIGVFAFGTFIFGSTHHAIFAGLALVISGAGYAAVVSTLNATAQSLFTPELRARVLALYLVVFYGSLAAGSFVFGQVAVCFSNQVSLIGAAVGLGVGMMSCSSVKKSQCQ